MPDLSLVQPALGTFPTIRSAFDYALTKETELGDLYNKMLIDFKDEPIVVEFVLGYVKEQRESIGEYADFIATLELCGDNQAALLQFDKELND